ncbi:MAG: hypothetical protein JWO32_474 [Bacteroidetes bacterium]|nr:hypothetical protein [Bacteroidota bacterium]
MEEINLHNYEAFLLDYFDGNLSKELTGKLMTFVVTHPELEIDLNDNDLPVFNAEEVHYELKYALKKENHNFPNEDLLEYLEGHLSEEDKLLVEARLNEDPLLALELKFLKQTVIAADYSISFKNKNQLIKSQEDLVLNNRSICFFENQLSEKEKADFITEVSVDKNLRDELTLVKHTLLLPDLTVVYPIKAELKKEAIVIPFFSVRLAIAAALFLVAGLIIVFTMYNSSPDIIPTQISKKGSAPPTNGVKPETNSFSTKEVSPLVADVSSPQNPNKTHLKNHFVFKKPNKDSQIVKENKSTKEEDLNAFPAIKDSSAIVSNDFKKESGLNSSHQEATTKYTNLNALATVVDTDDQGSEKLSKNTFWKRAVKLAQRANGLGLKAVKGDEKEKENYSLSFNSFSIEKK